MAPQSEEVFPANSVEPSVQWKSPKSPPQSSASIRRLSPWYCSKSNFQTDFWNTLHVCTSGTSCEMISALWLRPALAICPGSAGGGGCPEPQTVSSNKIQIRAEVHSSPLPSVSWCNQLGMAEGRQPHHATSRQAKPSQAGAWGLSLMHEPRATDRWFSAPRRLAICLALCLSPGVGALLAGRLQGLILVPFPSCPLP